MEVRIKLIVRRFSGVSLILLLLGSLAVGVEVNAAGEEGITALMQAAAGSHIRLLVKAGADLNAKSKEGETALAIARSFGDEATVKVLQQLRTEKQN